MTLKVSRRQSLKTRITLATLSIFLASLWSLSLFASFALHQDMQELLTDQQFSAVSVMAAAVDHEMVDRFHSLAEIAKSVGRVLPDDVQQVQRILEERPLLLRQFNGGVVALRQDGMAIADMPHTSSRIGFNFMVVDAVASALREGKQSVSRPVVAHKLLTPVFGMAVPVRDAKGQVIGALYGVTDLARPNFLNRITKNRYGKTGNYFVASPKHRLNIASSDKNRVMQALPAPGVNPAIDRFVAGYEGSARYVDQFGVEILVSVKGIPTGNWSMVATLPTAEAFAPIRALQLRMLLATVLLTLLAGALTWWILRRQLAPMLTAASTLARMSASDLSQPSALPIARPDEIGQLIAGFNRMLTTLAKRDAGLKEREERLRAITDNSGTVIFMKDLNGQYIYANRPFMALFHPTSPHLEGKTDFDLFPHDLAHAFSQADQRVIQSGQPFEVEEQAPHDDGIHTYLSVKFPLRRGSGEIYAVCGIATDITERKKAEEALRIAAVAFESQEGIVVMDTTLHFLRVNQAFTQITGFSSDEVQGKTAAILRSNRHPASHYDAIWDEVQRSQNWQGEMWLRRKNGANYTARVTVTAVRNKDEQVTHFVGNFTDETHSYLQEQQRLIDEAVLRETLVREVHHRIKNNLQGVTGLLRQFGKSHPDMADPINQAIGQVQGISVIHGLHGRTGSPQVRLCELITAIGGEIQTLWQTPVALELPTACANQWIIAESEAVPIALVLNELILNAIKHGGKAQGKVSIALTPGTAAGMVHISITNVGHLAAETVATHHSGLQLVRALMPHHGATLAITQHKGEVVTQLVLSPPVISLELEINHDNEPPT